MKKLLASLGLAFAIVGLSACGITEEFKDGPSLVLKTGILVEQTTTDKESGTHFLIDEAGKKTAVRSLTINLSGDEYLDNEVKADGLMNTTDNVFDISGITVKEILSKNTKQNKQIEYKNTDAGFRLSYVDDWKVTDSKDKNVVFTGPLVADGKSAAVVTIAQRTFAYEPKAKEDGTLSSALEFYYEQENEGKKFDGTLLSKIGVDKMDALKSVGNGKITYTLYRSGLIYDLSFVSADPATADDENIFNKMIADFQFVSMEAGESDAMTDAQSDDASEGLDVPKPDMDMTTFESLPYQFGGQYPAKWYYAGVKTSADATVLHHYGFSDEASNAKEIVSLDVLSNGIPGGGAKISFNGKDFDVFQLNDTYTVYTTLETRNFRLRGPVSYKDLVLYMAASMESVKKDKLD